MPLFVVRHQHDAARCPAQDPDMGASLLNHLSRPNVRQHGVEVIVPSWYAVASVKWLTEIRLIDRAFQNNGIQEMPIRIV